MNRVFAIASMVLFAACSSNAGTNNYGGGGFYDLGGPGLPTDTGGRSRPDGSVQQDGGTGQADTGAADGTASQDAGGTVVDAGVTDSSVADSGVQDSGATVEDSGTPDTTAQDTGTPDSGAPDTAKADDVPWGTGADAQPYDAGQYNYTDVKNTGGNTGSGGAGLCIPKISQLNLEKIKTGGKVDIVIFVDTSGSMGQEAKYVSNNLNAFGSYLASKALDYRVVLLGKSTGCCKLTITPPLGNNPAVFKHVNKPVYSLDGLKRIIDYYPDYKSFLRADATTNFLAITDDESIIMKSTVFEQKLTALNNPAFNAGYVFHSIVAYGPMAKKGCSTGARIGHQYLNLTAKTGGVKAPVCDSNWSKIFNDIAKGVVKTAKPPCTHAIPLPAGTSNAKGVNVNYVAEDDFFNVPPAKNNVCSGTGLGYTLDNPNNPKKVTLCSKSCNLLKGGGNIQFDFGCSL
ncbi:MAG: hypothetical protein KC502_21235 [Myxococcales bacterium]|nr:hypothetical protein [Myxococcales bacterium]